MSTPTAGPDDRSPQTEAEHEKRMFDLLIDLVSEARDVERFSTWAKNERSERESLDEVSRLRGEILSALRSARRDVAKAKSLEAVPPAERDSDGRIWLAGSFLDEDGNDQDLRWVAGVCQAARRLGYAITTEDHDQSNPTPFMLRMREYYAVSSSPPILEKND